MTTINGLSATASPATHAAGRRQRSTLPARRDLWLYAVLVVLTWGVWWFSGLDLFTAASDTGYWIGVAGGVCMVLLFTYPMRKRWRFMHRLGSGKPWFVAHMTLGVAGPLLILLHSTFRIGSINAGVALFSMLVVALSGVIGRFLYVRLHRNLHGEKLNLAGVRTLRAADDSAAGRLRFAPGVVQRLADFERTVLVEGRGAPRLGMALLRVPYLRWRAERACREELKIKVLAMTASEDWPRKRGLRLLKQARRLVHEELMALQRIAQFSAWERLFSWWHVAHVPFVYLMVLSAVIHVIAVHAY